MQNHILQNGKILLNTTKNVMLHVIHKHGKSHSVGVSQAHVQPTSNLPLSPQAAKKSDTPSTIDHSQDKCQLQHSQNTLPIDSSMEQFVIAIPAGK